jgi:hypothetical protein
MPPYASHHPNTPSSTLDNMSFAAIFYLALPICIFFTGWLRPAFSFIAITAITWGFYHATKSIALKNISFKQLINRPNIVIIVAALIWSVSGGAGHFFFANPDWITRDAVLRDLTLGSWPPSYGQRDGYDLILRAPIGYYLPASIAGKLFGIAIADSILWLWTFLGIYIFLNLLPKSESNIKNFICLLIIIFFSGMDILGWLRIQPTPPLLGLHLEWWAQLFQYSSNTTQLFWVPNHALPAWLAVALFYRHRNTVEFSRALPFICATLPLWSPFAAIGLAPFILVYVANKKRAKEILNIGNLWAPILILALISPYLILDMHTVPLESTTNGTNTPLQFVIHYGFFITIEFAIVVLLIYAKANRTILLTCLITLTLLPCLHLGPGNDIVMRGGIPALMLICIMTVHYIQQESKFNFRAALLAIVLLVGAITPLQEFYRALTSDRWTPNLKMNLIEISGSPPPHYVARLNNPLLYITMKEPAPVP